MKVETASAIDISGGWVSVGAIWRGINDYVNDGASLSATSPAPPCQPSVSQPAGIMLPLTAFQSRIVSSQMQMCSDLLVI